MKKPYIGITGFVSQDEAREILRMPGLDFRKRLIMIGILASQKTMNGLQNKWPNRYPTMDKIAGIFPKDQLALNLIHYNTKEPESLLEQLTRMVEIGGENLNGFQLNLAWPSPAAIEKFRAKFIGIQIVLQVGNHAMEIIGHSEAKLARRVTEYKGLVDYVLLDPSGGYGKEFNPKAARNYLNVLKFQNLDIGLGVAGGLSPDTLHLIEPLAKDFPGLCVDAEGRLRDDNDSLSLRLAKDYVSRALQILR